MKILTELKVYLNALPVAMMKTPEMKKYVRALECFVKYFLCKPG